jgi:hypothetical protein
MRKSVPFSLLSSSSFHFEKEEKFPFVSHQWPNSRRNEDDDDQVSSSSYLLLVARALFRRRPALDVEKKKMEEAACPIVGYNFADAGGGCCTDF